ncbi:ApaLI family restriction endonuclease, partial [Enterocloster lavalensis]|uniref:ApaLI family restriction endonuclease n=1 Tax=Enterocloster lavalensis TaxID=460384 RepID=UPI002FDADA06
MDMSVYESIKRLADAYATRLKQQVDLRIEEMKADDNSHYLLYRVLGFSNDEGRLIDLYQNKTGACLELNTAGWHNKCG